MELEPFAGGRASVPGHGSCPGETIEDPDDDDGGGRGEGGGRWSREESGDDDDEDDEEECDGGTDADSKEVVCL